MIYLFEFVEYSCRCGYFLFNSSDVISQTSIFGRQFLLVKPERVGYDLLFKRIFFFSPNIIRCSNCRRFVGAIVFPFDGEREILRFSSNCIVPKCFFIVKENEL